MTTGLPRREQAQDSLAGERGVQPVTLQGPAVSNPRPIRAEPDTASAQLTQQLLQWGGDRLSQAVGKQQERSILEGQMAYQQGKAFEDVEMGGNKWALEGYRLMDAQTISSTLLAAQREHIAQSGHQMSPEQFRDSYINRLDGMLEGSDPRTAQLVRQQMAEQMPTLVADHTRQHLAWQEEQTWNSLERSIDVISRDPTAGEQLIDFAQGGTGSVSSGLTDERRMSAVAAGVVRALKNDNPLAYTALSAAGMFEQMTTQQQDAIRAARKAYQGRRKSELNVGLLNEVQAIDAQIESGELSPQKAVEAYVLAHAGHGIELNQNEAMAVFDGAERQEQITNKTATVLIEDANLRGDFDTVARIGARALFGGQGVRVRPGQQRLNMTDGLGASSEITDRVGAAVESVLGPGATVQFTSGLRANDRGSQHSTGGAADFKVIREDGSVVRWDDPEIKEIAEVASTMGVLGFGAGPTYMGGEHFHFDLGHGGAMAHTRQGITVWSDDDGGAADHGPGAAKWYQSLVNASAGTSGLDSEQSMQWASLVQKHDGNIVSAGIEMEFGQESVEALANGNASEAVMARAKAIQGELDNWRAPTASDRLDIARAQLQNTRQRLAMDQYDQYAPRVAALDDAFANGDLAEGTWRERRRQLFAAYDQDLTRADIDHEIRMVQQVDAAAQKAATQVADQDYALALNSAQTEIVPARLNFEEAMADETLTPEQRQTAAQEYMSFMQETFDRHGIEVLDRNNVGVVDDVLTRWRAGERAHREFSEGTALIGNANTANTVGTLPKPLQERALEEFSSNLEDKVANAVAENPGISAAEVGAMHRSQLMDYVARNGIVNPEMQQMVNLAASGQAWLSRDGSPNPSVVAGLHTFTTLMSMNPDLAYQYVPDPEARGRMLAASFMVQTEFPDVDVFSEVDLSNRSDPIANAFHTAVEQVGLAMDRPASEEQTASRVEQSMRLMASGNLTNSWFGGVGAMSVSQRLIPTSALSAGMSSKFDIADVNAGRRIDGSRVDGDFEREVGRFLEEVMPFMPSVSKQGAVTMALDYVRDRGAVMGSSYVMPKPGEPSVRSQMFPGQQVVNTAAVNTAISQWMVSEEARTQYPFLEEAHDTWFWQGDPEFTVHRIGDVYSATIPGFGNVPLNLREIGDLYVSNR